MFAPRFFYRDFIDDNFFHGIAGIWFSARYQLNAKIYRITISWWMFVAAVLPAMLIALATVSYQAVRAAFNESGKEFKGGVKVGGLIYNQYF